MSGMKPPSASPRSARNTKKWLRFLINACNAAINDHKTICIGIHVSMKSQYRRITAGIKVITTWPKSLAQHLRRKFSNKKAKIEYHLTIVVIVGVHLQIFQQIIGSCLHTASSIYVPLFPLMMRNYLHDIASVELQGKEGETTPCHDLYIQSSD